MTAIVCQNAATKSMVTLDFLLLLGFVGLCTVAVVFVVAIAAKAR